MASMVPSERLRRELDEIVAGVGDEDDPIETIGRLGARFILQQALEEELTEPPEFRTPEFRSSWASEGCFGLRFGLIKPNRVGQVFENVGTWMDGLSGYVVSARRLALAPRRWLEVAPPVVGFPVL